MSLPYRFLSSRFAFLLVVGVIAWTFATWALTESLGLTGLVIGLGLFAIPATLVVGEMLMRLVHLKRKVAQDREQYFALAGLYASLDLKLPLIQLGRFALSPDSAVLYQHLIAEHHPTLIVEFGSGASTIIAGASLRRYGGGRVVALDHERQWAETSRTRIGLEGLGDVCEVRHAPLTENEFGGGRYRWYDAAALEGLEKVDMLLVDGPPDGNDAGNREPALHAMLERLSDRAVILADDTGRARWNRFVRNWAAEHGFSMWQPYPNEKGALVLTRGV